MEGLFQASLLASGALLAIIGEPWLEVAPPLSLTSSLCDILPEHVSVSKFPLFIRTAVILH